MIIMRQIQKKFNKSLSTMKMSKHLMQISLGIQEEEEI